MRRGEFGRVRGDLIETWKIQSLDMVDVERIFPLVDES